MNIQNENIPILYIKAGCHWCNEVISFFKIKKIDLNIIDVNRDINAMRKLQKISGQNKTPSLVFKDFSIYDFDLSEFIEKANQNCMTKKYFQL